MSGGTGADRWRGRQARRQGRAGPGASALTVTLALTFAAGVSPVPAQERSGAQPRPAAVCLGDGPFRPGTLSTGEGDDPAWRDQAGDVRPVRLAGLVPATDPVLAALLTARLAEGAGQGAAAPAGQADRWGRAPVLVRQGARLLNEVLLQEGLARFRPGEVSATCARLLIAAEARARRLGLGGWSAQAGSPVFAVIDASQTAAWTAAIGRFVVVEGRVFDVGDTRSRIYLNFGEDRSQDFTVFVQKRNLRNVEASGMRWSQLEGRRIRVRGTLVESGGPLMEVNSPEAIERLD